MTPASSTPPSDAEVIERVLELEDTFENSLANELRERFEAQSSASKAALPDEVAEVVKAVRAFAKLADDALPSSDHEWGNKEFLQTACRTSRSLIRTTVSRIDELDTLLSALAARAQTAEDKSHDLAMKLEDAQGQLVCSGCHGRCYDGVDDDGKGGLVPTTCMRCDGLGDERKHLKARIKTAEAVAAKSREEALEEAAKWHDLKVADADSVQAIANTSVGIVASLMHEIHEESAAALRALKSSRTDSGQPPATNTDESGRASALNAPLTDANAPTSDK